MKKLRTFDLAVIGGGITGIGIARKAAAMGFGVILIEQNEVGSGTSGHFHELLHSGARYAVNDPVAAKECYLENRALSSKSSLIRRAIRQTGGYFLAITDDDVAYSEKLVASCKTIGIPIVEKNIGQFFKKEPYVTKLVKRALWVPDGFIDGRKTLDINKRLAQEFGAKLLTHHKVVSFQKKDKKIEAVIIQDSDGQQHTIFCGFVINAAGAWSASIGKLAGVSIGVVPYRGALIVYKDVLCKSVLNRCHKPSNGDIVVPTSTHTIFGTTSKKTNDVDNFQIEKDEIEILNREGDLLIPGMSKHPVETMYAGIRPLFSITDFSDGRDISRSFRVINHKEEGIINFISVIGGKFTIYERMGDKAVEAMKQNAVL